MTRTATRFGKFGSIDHVVNNAGIFISKPFIDYTTEDFLKLSGTNLEGFLYLTQLAVKQMLAQGAGGSVTSITTSLADNPISNLPVSIQMFYKGGLNAIALSLASEYAKNHIRFNAVAPGVVDTPLHKNVESRSRAPMLPIEVFVDSTFSAATVIGWITNVAFYGLIFVLSLFFQRIQGYTALQTGLAFFPMTAIILPADLASGWLATRTGARLPIFVGQILMLVGCAGLLEVSEGTPYWRMTAQLPFIGSGIGLTVPAMTSALLGTVDQSRSGIASGVLNAARQAGSIVGVGLFGTFVIQLNHMVAGLRLVLLISVGILLASTLLTFIIPARRAWAHRRLDKAAAVQRAGAIR